MIPRKVHFFSGSATHPWHKNARDHASHAAGVADLSLVATSSVLPAGIAVIGHDAFRAEVTPGQVVFAIHGIAEGNTPGQRLTSVLAAVVPDDDGVVGYVAELFEWPGLVIEKAVARTEQMALQIFADRHGADGYDAEAERSERQKHYWIGGLAVTLHTAQATIVVPDSGDWACAMAGAVLLPWRDVGCGR